MPHRFGTSVVTLLTLIDAPWGGTAVLAQDPPTLNVEFVGEIELNRAASPNDTPPTSDIYVAGGYAYIGTLVADPNELYIVDVSDPARMRLASTVPIVGTAHDVKVDGDLAVVAGHPTPNGNGGLTIIDVSNPETPQILNKLSEPCVDGVHNVFLHAGHAYLAHVFCPGLTIVDLADPANPVVGDTWLNEIPGFSNVIHDVFIDDGIAYISDVEAGAGGLILADISDPDHLRTLATLPVPEGTHSAAAEGGYVYFNQEFNPASPMRVADVRDPRHPVEIGAFWATDFVSNSVFGSHNPWVEDGLLYWAHYDSGLRIFDLHDPANPVEIGYYVTGSTWGVQPYRDGIVLISENTLSGLRAVRFVPPSHAIRSLSLSQPSFVHGRQAAPELRIAARTEPFPSASPGEIVSVKLSFPDMPSQTPVSLTPDGDSTYVGHWQIPDSVRPGKHTLLAVLEDDRGHTYPFPTPFVVYPATDAIIAADGLDPQWQQTLLFSADVDYAATEEVYSGATAIAVTASGVNLELTPSEPIPTHVYRALGFTFHPGDLDPDRRSIFRVFVNDNASASVDLIDAAKTYIDLEQQEWQVVEIPLSDFTTFGDFDLKSVRFHGNLRGTFYLDDLRLLTDAPPPATAVAEGHQDAHPQTTVLRQNYPNPFNDETLIPFDLPAAADVELSVYNLSGQRVATLAGGQRPAGVYQLHWDGRDDDGRMMASGTYLLRLRAGEVTQTRKVLLLR